MKCLDTDLLIAILRGKEEAYKKVIELDEEGKQATTAISAFELFYGANKSERKTENVKEALKIDRKAINFSASIFLFRKEQKKLAAKLVAKGETIDFRYVMIGGIALEKDFNGCHTKQIRLCENQGFENRALVTIKENKKQGTVKRRVLLG